VALARTYLELESHGRAEAAVEAALAQDHDHAGAHLMLSDLKRAREDFPAAIEVLESLDERGVEDAQMRRQVAAALKRARDDAARHAALLASAGSTPPSAASLVDLARFLSGRGAHRRAAELLDRAAAVLATAAPPDPAGAERVLFERGVELLEGRHYAEAARLFERLAGDPPAAAPIGAPPAGDPEAPGAASNGAPFADARLRAASRFNLGVARAAMGLHAEAHAVFAAYSREHPEDARALLYLGNASYRLGREAEARAAYAAYLDLSPPGSEADRVQRLLRRLERPARAEDHPAGERRPPGPAKETS
jgi:tetratricopeptide (TPR) repeat protein